MLFRSDGLNKVYGRAFVDSLPMDELVGVIIHEASHILFSHAYLWLHLWKQDAQRANRAADYVINLMIDELAQRINVGKAIISLPDCALLDKKYQGMDTQEVFNALAKDDNTPPEDGQQSFDEHDFKELTPEEVEQVTTEIEEAIREGKLHAGRMGGSKNATIDKLLEPEVRWEDVMRQFAYEYARGEGRNDWARPNRRHLQFDAIMPSRRTDRIRAMVVVNDTSGSVDKELLSTFLEIGRAHV